MTAAVTRTRFRFAGPNRPVVMAWGLKKRMQALEKDDPMDVSGVTGAAKADEGKGDEGKRREALILLSQHVPLDKSSLPHQHIRLYTHYF